MAIAVLAGADMASAIRLGLAMLATQCSIGALNDLVDAPLDAREKPRKPIPSGQATAAAARAVAAAGAVIGIALSAVSGPATAVAAAGCLALGWGYDLRLSRTAWSWLPLALALPLLPIHAWLGATGMIPPGLLTLVPVAVLGGAGLSIANGLVDVERDARGGRRAVAVTLGRRWAWPLQTVLLFVAAGLAIVIAPGVPDVVGPASSGTSGGINLAMLRALRIGAIGLGAACIGLGSVLLAARRPGIRERGWELEALGVAALGLGWLAGTAGAVAAGPG